MADFLSRTFPNTLDLWPDLLKATGETFIMVSISFLITVAIGFPLGVLLMATKNKSLFYNNTLYKGVSAIIDVLRSTPTVILITAISPLTKILTGSKIGIRGAIVPLVFASAPFLARQIEAALVKTDPGIIRAAKSMGNSPLKIITSVILPESLSSLIMALTLTFVSLINFSAIAGTVGGGGLGDFALRYGYQQFKWDIMIITIVFLVVFVIIIQSAGKHLSHKLMK
ncbi:MAG: ABC transporter permease [Clostridiales bacterium]|nr:ABC transporter permease [Clostridiales bacterium]